MTTPKWREGEKDDHPLSRRGARWGAGRSSAPISPSAPPAVLIRLSSPPSAANSPLRHRRKKEGTGAPNARAFRFSPPRLREGSRRLPPDLLDLGEHVI